nr:M48 family metallopeptidase [Burkholderiaceae bacterium]
MSRWTAPWTLLQRSLFDEPEPDLPAASPAAVAALPAAPRVALAGEVFKHPRAQRDVRLDGHLVAYEMRRARRRSIGFVVGPEGLTVSVPRWVGLKEVDSALQEKRRWILHKLREQRERAARLHSARIDWCDGTELP